MLDARLIGNRIRNFRELAGLSKSELARRVGVSPTAVHNWEENGTVPRIDLSHALSEALEVSFVQLMSGDNSSGNPSPLSTSSPDQPEISRNERLDQFRRQIAALF